MVYAIERDFFVPEIARNNVSKIYIMGGEGQK